VIGQAGREKQRNRGQMNASTLRVGHMRKEEKERNYLQVGGKTKRE